MIATAPNTAWKSGRLDARRGPHKLLFGCMHEDLEVERKAFAPGGRIFCIASAGCTAMALSAEHEVVAVDLNPLQIGYVERRLASAIVERGSAERLLEFARRIGPLAGWTPARVREFIALSLPNEQMAYWRAYLDTRRFRIGLDLLFARRMLRAYYADAFLGSLPENFGLVMRQRMERCFSRHPNCRNPYARMLLLGQRPPDPSPVYAKRVSLEIGDAAEFLENQSAGSFSGFTLSNIFDGVSTAYAQRLVQAVQQAAAPDATVIVRSFREPVSASPSNRAADDRSMLWGIVGVWPVNQFSLGMEQIGFGCGKGNQKSSISADGA